MELQDKTIRIATLNTLRNYKAKKHLKEINKINKKLSKIVNFVNGEEDTEKDTFISDLENLQLKFN
jgi:hypothetical protein